MRSLLLLSLLFPLAVHGDLRTRATAEIVASLDFRGDTFATLKLLDTRRCEALPLLVAELKPVRPGQYGSWGTRPYTRDAEHISVVLMALRMLTHHDEYGPITAAQLRALPVQHRKPGETSVMDAEDLTHNLPNGRSRFSGYWMSRGESYFAPLETQRAIIGQWRVFLDNFDCRAPLPDARFDPYFVHG